MPDSYQFLRLRAPGRDTAELLKRLRDSTLPRLRDDGAECWGLWQGLFGIASSELFMMAAVPGDRTMPEPAGYLPPEASVVDSVALSSTVRPSAIEPVTGEGLYVFRFFEVQLSDCDEIVALSREAWETFEGSDRYASRPMGLFAPRGGDGGSGRMLLVTWYDGFASWETSRAPAPEARRNFQRRHALTSGTVAYATRLVQSL